MTLEYFYHFSTVYPDNLKVEHSNSEWNNKPKFTNEKL